VYCPFSFIAHHLALVRYTPDEASSGLKASSSNVASCPTAVGNRNSSILNGCTIHVSKKLEVLAPELYTIAEHLGAQTARKFDPTQVTHLIHQSSRATEPFQEFRLARSANIHIVHPQWLLQCRSLGTRCDEDKWGWMWDAERSLSVVETDDTGLMSPEARCEKRPRQDENIPPSQVADSAKFEQLARLLGTIASPQKKTKRKLAGRARTTQTSTATSSIPSPENVPLKSDEEEAPRPTQEKVEYRDPVAEREMAKIVANLRGITDDNKAVQAQSSEMTPAEDIGRRGGRRKSTRK
jgi:BRCA1 C Terminus (BRCT) domain